MGNRLLTAITKNNDSGQFITDRLSLILRDSPRGMHINYSIPQAHTLEPRALAEMLQTDLKAGLAVKEAEKRALKLGPNVYEPRKPPGIGKVLLKQFKSIIVYLLFAGAAISLYFYDIPEAISILVVILVNAGIGFFMEWQANTAMKALKRLDIITAKVLREGFLLEIDATQLVPGDLLQLEAGDVVPADGRLIDVQQLRCDESPLTGESIPADKNTNMAGKDLILAERNNMVFKGTAVTHGNGKAIVTGIARHTALGEIAAMADVPEDSLTPLNRKLDRLTRELILGTLALTALFTAISALQGKSLLLILETAIALLVASIPEGLPVVTTIALSSGMLAMARRNAIIKNLPAVETLGSTDIILTDKTGTLTENKIEIDKLTFPQEKFTLPGDGGLPVPGKSGPNLEKLILTGILCNNAPGRSPAAADPVEAALLTLGSRAALDIAETLKRYPRLTEIPFSSEAMMMISLHQASDGYFTAAKGAAERLLEICDRVQLGREIRKLTLADRTHILQQAEEMADEGLRVLGFAWKLETRRDHDHFRNQLVFTGLAGLLDTARSDVREAIGHCRQAGIKVVMITGDHPRTALNIARRVGLTDDLPTEAISGKLLPAAEKMTAEWKQKVLTGVVFARTTPQQKFDIAAVYQQAGHIVAMTGDGINDAPALKKADIGIAMGLRGTQVARETADIVLKDDSFASIVEAIARGRAIFRNIQKFVVYLVSCNLTEVLTITALGAFIPGASLWPMQILFLNVVTDVFPALALGVGAGDASLMRRPPRNPAKAILYREKWIGIIRDVVAMTAAIVAATAFCRSLGYHGPVLNTVAFFTLTISQLAYVFNMRDEDAHWLVNDITRNKFIWLAIVLCLFITGAAYVVPGLHQVLRLVQLPRICWLIAAVGGIIPLVVSQFFQLIAAKFRKHAHAA